MPRLILVWLLLGPPVVAHAASAVHVQFVYDQRTDEQCASARAPIKAEWSAELRSRLPEFRALWESVGPAMVNAVTALTRKPFTPPDTVRLTLCDIPSNSLLRPTVNMRYSLRSFTSAPVPMRYKVDTAFHELLHDFVARNVPGHSALLATHPAESTCVRNHLHLLALQKAVLRSNNDSEALAQLITIDGDLPSGCYRRAWALVNATPGIHMQYVAELSQ